MKISIITAVHNNKNEIESCLKTVLAQDYPNLEYIIIDGGSTDGTLEILNKYKNQIQTIISEPDKGIYDALNKGITYAKGQIVGFLHSDDLYPNHKVISKIACTIEKEKVDALYGDLLYVQKNDTDKTIRHWKSSVFNKTNLRAGWMPPHPTLFVRKKYYEILGGFNQEYKIAADYDWILRFLSLPDIKVTYLPEILVKMRWGGTSNGSIRKIVKKSIEDYKAIRRNGAGNLLTLINKNLSKIRQFIL